jgi:Tfp pilus assembly protein PilF
VASSLGCATEPPLPPKAVELNRTGAAALAAGDFETAEARLALALEYNPRFTEARVNLGLVEMSRGDYDKARKDLLKARDLNADLPAPHHALGLLADKRGAAASRDEAEKHYRAALKVDPGFTPARANLGRRLFERGAYVEANEQFLRLTEIAPDVLDGWLGLVECLLRIGRETDADAALARARSSFGDSPEIVLLVARQMLRRGVYAEAETVLAPLTSDADKTRQGVAWSWIAVARLAQGNKTGALVAARESLLVDKADAVARHVLLTANAM